MYPLETEEVLAAQVVQFCHFFKISEALYSFQISVQINSLSTLFA